MVGHNLGRRILVNRRNALGGNDVDVRRLWVAERATHHGLRVVKVF